MVSNGPFAILRVKALSSWSAVAAMSRHGRRKGDDMHHVDRTRSPQNRYGSEWSADPANLRSCVEAVATHHGAVRRKGSPIASHLLLTASPEYFRPGQLDAMGTYDAGRLETWLAANLKWINSRWPGQLAAWRLDLDEATPHLDAFLVPIHRWQTKSGKTVTQVSHRAAFSSSRRSFGELQSEYAKAMEPLGLHRGRLRSVTGAVHVHPAELRRRMAVDAAHQKAQKVGLGAILRRDLRMLRLDEKGAPTAVFSGSVPIGARPRMLEICKPAWPMLMRLERELLFQAGRFVKEAFHELLEDAKADRQEASRTLDEARDIFDFIRDRDRRLKGRSWEDVVLELVR